jgi:hypothetical protein
LDPRSQGTVKIKKMVQYALGFQTVNFVKYSFKEKIEKLFHLGSGGKQKECSNC